MQEKIKKKLKELSNKEKKAIALFAAMFLMIIILGQSSSDYHDKNIDLSNQVTDLKAKVKEDEEIISNLKHPDITKKINIPATKDIYKNVADGKKVTLGYGTFEVGKDIEPGTYTLKVKSGYDNVFIRSVLGYTDYSTIMGFNQFDAEAAKDHKNVELESGQTIEITDVELQFIPNTEKELVKEASPASVEEMTKTYDEKGNETYSCIKDSENIECDELTKKGVLEKQITLEENK